MCLWLWRSSCRFFLSPAFVHDIIKCPNTLILPADSASSDFKPMENLGLRVRAKDGYIEVVPAHPLNSPDPLLYFGQGPQIEGATLLGALEGSQMRRFAVPGSGYLILYSLARREIVGFERLNVSWSSR